MSQTQGILNIDKPPGISSRDAVNRVQRLLGRGKIGHAGTLDPLAGGVLVVAVGAATRLIRLVQQMPKAYDAEFLLGRSSDTDDVEGEVRTSQAPLPDEAAVRAALPSFVGRVLQRPPAYSAVKVRGRRAYQLARRGDEVKLEAREVRIDEVRLLEYRPPQLRLRVRCGSGVYIRAIGRDLGERLGCGAVMSKLVRTAVGCFVLEQAAAIDGLTTRQQVTAALAPSAAAASQLPSVTLASPELAKLAHGQQVAAQLPQGGECGECAVLDAEGRLRAVARSAGEGRIRAVVNLPAEG